MFVCLSDCIRFSWFIKKVEIGSQQTMPHRRQCHNFGGELPGSSMTWFLKRCRPGWSRSSYSSEYMALNFLWASTLLAEGDPTVSILLTMKEGKYYKFWARPKLHNLPYGFSIRWQPFKENRYLNVLSLISKGMWNYIHVLPLQPASVWSHPIYPCRGECPTHRPMWAITWATRKDWRGQ